MRACTCAYVRVHASVCVHLGTRVHDCVFARVFAGGRAVGTLISWVLCECHEDALASEHDHKQLHAADAPELAHNLEQDMRCGMLCAGCCVQYGVAPGHVACCIINLSSVITYFAAGRPLRRLERGCRTDASTRLAGMQADGI